MASIHPATAPVSKLLNRLNEERDVAAAIAAFRAELPVMPTGAQVATALHRLHGQLSWAGIDGPPPQRDPHGIDRVFPGQVGAIARAVEADLAAYEAAPLKQKNRPELVVRVGNAINNLYTAARITELHIHRDSEDFAEVAERLRSSIEGPPPHASAGASPSVGHLGLKAEFEIGEAVRAYLNKRGGQTQADRSQLATEIGGVLDRARQSPVNASVVDWA